MAGNFVTLTNLPPQEMDRMIERHAVSQNDDLPLLGKLELP